MGGDKGTVRKGRSNDSGAGVEGGTLGHDQLLFKEPKVLLKDGKIAPGTKAAKQAASNQRIKAYEKKLKFEDIHRTGAWNNGVKSL